MIKMTQSLEHWLFKYHRDKFTLIMLGHIEVFTDEMQKDYIEWCKTYDVRQVNRNGQMRYVRFLWGMYS